MRSDLRARWLRCAGGRLHGGGHREGLQPQPDGSRHPVQRRAGRHGLRRAVHRADGRQDRAAVNGAAVPLHPVQRHADFIGHPRRDGTGADAVLHRPRHRRRAGEHQHRRRGIRLQPAAQPVDLADVAGLSDRRHAGRRVLGLPDLRVRLAVGLCVRRAGGPDPGARRHPLHAGIAGLPDRPPPSRSAGQGQPRAGPHRPVRPCPPSPRRNGRRKRPTPACSPSSGLPMPGGRWRCASRISA